MSSHVGTRLRVVGWLGSRARGCFLELPDTHSPLPLGSLDGSPSPLSPHGSKPTVGLASDISFVVGSSVDSWSHMKRE